MREKILLTTTGSMSLPLLGLLDVDLQKQTKYYVYELAYCPVCKRWETVAAKKCLKLGYPLDDLVPTAVGQTERTSSLLKRKFVINDDETINQDHMLCYVMSTPIILDPDVKPLTTSTSTTTGVRFCCYEKLLNDQGGSHHNDVIWQQMCKMQEHRIFQFVAQCPDMWAKLELRDALMRCFPLSSETTNIDSQKGPGQRQQTLTVHYGDLWVP